MHLPLVYVNFLMANYFWSVREDDV